MSGYGGGRRAALATAAVLALGLAAPTAVAAPTDDDVRDAQAAVSSAAVQVAEIEIRLAGHAAAVEDAWSSVAAAAEDYTRATVERDEAAHEAVEATERHAAAEAEVEAARAHLGTIAMQAYRSGGSMDTLGAMLSSDGLEDLLARTAALDRLGGRAERAVQRYQAADLVARTLSARAEEAVAHADASAAAAEGALETAQQAHADAEAQVAEVQAQRDGLISRLAALRQTSVAIERARQDHLDAERARRADAAAAADRGVTTPGVAPVDQGRSPGATDPAPPASQQPSPQQPAPEQPAPEQPAPQQPAPQQPGPAPTAPAPSPTTPAPAPSPTPPPAPAPAPSPTPAPPVSDPHGLGTGSARGSASQGQSAVAWAVAQVGSPYLFGGTGQGGFDCSGLTMRAWQNAGLSINRTSRDQYRQVRKITYDSMRPGDLIFYGSNGSDPGSITHVAMFVGNGQMVEAPRPGVNVRVTAIRWGGTMPYAGRP